VNAEPPRRRTERGQTTAEFVGGLVLVGVVVVAAIAWADDAYARLIDLIDQVLVAMRDGPG